MEIVHYDNARCINTKPLLSDRWTCVVHNCYVVFKHAGSRISEYDFNGQFTITDSPLRLECESTPLSTGFFQCPYGSLMITRPPLQTMILLSNIRGLKYSK